MKHLFSVLIFITLVKSTFADEIDLDAAWYATSVDSYGASSALAVRDDGQSSLGMVFHIITTCTPMIIIGANANVKDMTPQWMKMPVEIKINNKTWKANDVRVGVSGNHMETLIPIGNHPTLINAIKDSQEISIVANKEKPITMHLNGASEAIKKAKMYCVNNIAKKPQ